MHAAAILLSFLLLPVLTSAEPLQEDQIVMNPQTQPEYTPQTNAQPTLADLLTIENSLSIFYSYARETQLSALFADEKAKLTMFVPTNKAVIALPRKPHQGPQYKDDIKLTEEQFDQQSRKTVERWVEAHIIDEYPLTLDTIPHDTLLKGKTISFTPIPKNDGQGPEWSRVTLDNGARIVAKKEASNGDLYIIDGTISVD